METLLLPDHRPRFQIERHERLSGATDDDDHHVHVDQRAARVAAFRPRPTVLSPKIMRPNHGAGLFLKGLQFADDADRDEQIARQQWRRVRASDVEGWFDLQVQAGRRRGVALFPDSLASGAVERDDELLGAFAVHRVKPVSVHDDGRMTFAQGPAPQPLRAAGRPGFGQTFGLDHKVALRPAPLRPALRRGGNAQSKPAYTKQAEPVRECFCATLLSLHLMPFKGQRTLLQSHRSAWSGSTFVARRAGIQHASNATTSSNNAITMNVSGSVALTPYSKLLIKRVAPYAASNPTTTPASASLSSYALASRRTPRAFAPSAMCNPMRPPPSSPVPGRARE